MPFAANGQVSTDPIEGGIEITNEQYSEAIAGIMLGKVITVVDGVLVIDFPAPEPEPEPDPGPTQDEITAYNIRSAPGTLFGELTLGDVFHGN